MKRIYPHTKGASGAKHHKKDARYGVGVYLDYAATTPVDPRVSAAMRPYFSKIFGNPSSLHQFGQEASRAVFLARQKIAESIGANYREIIFTGSATEANNLALRGVVKIFDNPRANIQRKRHPFAPAANGASLSAQNSGIKPETNLLRFRDVPLDNLPYDPKFLPLRIIVSAIEHESVLETCRDLEKEGIEVVYIPVSKNGIVDLKKIKNALNEQTILVSIMHANNEVGTIQPIAEISEIVKAFSVQRSAFREKNKFSSLHPIPYTPYPIFHTDAVQSFQYLDCNVDALGVDLMTLSAHKIYGPKGIGVLYVRKAFSDQRLAFSKKYPEATLNPNRHTLYPIIIGSGQEFGLRSGTENVPCIVGFGKAVEIANQLKKAEVKRLGKLRDYFYMHLKKILPKIEINGSLKQRLPNNLNIYFPKIKPGSRSSARNSRFTAAELSLHGRSQELLIKLDLAGIAASLGAACFSRTAQPSYVLRAMGFSLERALGSLRFSLGRQTTKKDIEYTIAVLVKLAKRQR